MIHLNPVQYSTLRTSICQSCPTISLMGCILHGVHRWALEAVNRLVHRWGPPLCGGKALHACVPQAAGLSCKDPQSPGRNKEKNNGWNIYIYIYKYMLIPAHQGLPFFLLHWLFHCEVKHLLSAIWQKNNALESLLPFPHPKVGLPRLCCFVCFFCLCCFSPFFPCYPPSKTQPKTSHPKCVYVYSFCCGGEVAS